MGKRLVNSATRKIVIAVASTIFSLFSVFSASIAWFQAMDSYYTSVSSFAVVNSSTCSLDGIRLIKFNYNVLEISEDTYLVEYDHPELGEVKNYGYSDTYSQFGETISSTWYPVSTMNLYDPAEKIISEEDFDLKSLHCNAIYEVSLSVAAAGTYYMDAIANRLTSKSKTANQIYLSTILDFDVYTEDEVFAAIGNDEDGKPLYYPSYRAKNYAMNSAESIYYRVSYLSDQEASHENFYENDFPNNLPLVSNKSVVVENDNSIVKIYVNVNYAPDEMEDYVELLDQHVVAVFDYSLTFNFKDSAS